LIGAQFLLVRPAPSFNITFTSATMRDEDVLQTEFFQHIGGSVRVRDGLKDALSQGHKVTAKVRWSSRYRRKGGGGGFDTGKGPGTPTRLYPGGSSGKSAAGGDEGFWLDAAPSDYYPSSQYQSHQQHPLPQSRSSRKDEVEGELRWIHCTPLVDASGRIGVWVIMLIDE
jgi:hypothetical protein